jgi:hypothetical protein
MTYAQAINVAPSTQPEFIRGIAAVTVVYAAAFDPNQLKVENITPLPDGNYEVTFRLLICNCGAGAVDDQDVTISYPAGAFWNFNYTSNFPYHLISNDIGEGEWSFNIRMLLPGIPPPSSGQYEEECNFINFKAITDCNGVRSLWRENGGKTVEACVIFKQAMSLEPHCTLNVPVSCDEFRLDGCACCSDKCERTDDGGCSLEWWQCLLLLLLILLILLWLVKSKYIPWLSKLFS